MNGRNRMKIDNTTDDIRWDEWPDPPSLSNLISTLRIPYLVFRCIVAQENLESDNRSHRFLWTMLVCSIASRHAVSYQQRMEDSIEQLMFRNRNVDCRLLCYLIFSVVVSQAEVWYWCFAEDWLCSLWYDVEMLVEFLPHPHRDLSFLIVLQFRTWLTWLSPPPDQSPAGGEVRKRKGMKRGNQWRKYSKCTV